MNAGVPILIAGIFFLCLTALVARLPLRYWVVFTDNETTKRAVRKICLPWFAVLSIAAIVGGLMSILRSQP